MKLYISIIIILFGCQGVSVSQETTKAFTVTGSADTPINSFSQTVIKDDDGSYYIDVSVSRCDTLFIGNEIIVCEEFPEEYGFDEGTHLRHYIVKLTPDLEMDTFLWLL